MPTVDDILHLFETRGDSLYGGEQVTQLEHALQSAALAEAEQSTAALVVAALLHDIGHLLHDLPDDAPDSGVDDHHETAGQNYLSALFPAAVTEPVRLHVPAKRYLCTVDADYSNGLSQPSVVSLRLQGGPMTPEEVERFRASPFAEDALRLRRWDDTAKVPDLATPPLSHYAGLMHELARKDART